MNTDSNIFNDSNAGLPLDSVAETLAEKWRVIVHNTFGDHIDVNCYAVDQEPLENYCGLGDIVVDLIDLSYFYGQTEEEKALAELGIATDGPLDPCLPHRDVIDFVLDGMRKEYPAINFDLDQYLDPRPTHDLYIISPN